MKVLLPLLLASFERALVRRKALGENRKFLRGYLEERINRARLCIVFQQGRAPLSVNMDILHIIVIMPEDPTGEVLHILNAGVRVMFALFVLTKRLANVVFVA
jgi:hypothetical protein